MKKSQIIVAAGTAIGLSAAAMAQNADQGVWGYGTPGDNPGDLMPGSLTNVQGQTGETGNLGIQYLNGTYWVSTRGTVIHKIHAFDAGGTLTNSIDQVTGAQGSAWGYRDGASDVRVVPVTDKVGHGELPELSQIRS